MFDTKKLALFLGGVVFGSAGFKVLSSKDAKKVYTQTTAAVLRMKDCTMQTVNKVQEEACMVQSFIRSTAAVVWV